MTHKPGLFGECYCDECYYYVPRYPSFLTCKRCPSYFNGRCTECGAALKDYWDKRSMRMEQKLIDQLNEAFEALEDIYLLVEGKTTTRNAKQIEEIALRIFNGK